MDVGTSPRFSVRGRANLFPAPLSQKVRSRSCVIARERCDDLVVVAGPCILPGTGLTIGHECEGLGQLEAFETSWSGEPCRTR